MSLQSCTTCAYENPASARFCMECGTSLALTCPSCGEVASAGKFCASCGAPLHDRAATPPPATAQAAVSERRVVSLLFADLVGFTTLSESRDPEAVRELLSAYFERTRAVIERYGGTVEKFIGDAVCAIFGVPVAREDDGERAVRAGLDLVSAVTALGDELHLEGLELRVGITTGAVAVTLGAVGEGMVAGDAVNTAARVQAAAGPGEVWVDDTTRSLTTASLAYEGVGSHALKGKAIPVELFRAVRTTAAVGGSQRVDGLEAPFVGRDRELRIVKELFHATAEEGRARLVLVTGEPGIGKSRLSWEFEKYLDAITSSRTYWLRGRCVSYGQGVAGRVVAEMVRSLLRVTEEDVADEVLRALDERLERHVADQDDRAVLRPRLLSLLGLSDEVFAQGDLFACWRGFLEALSSGGSSVTLVVEDLQWADDGLLDFLEHLLDAAGAPVMVLALARPEVSQRRPGLGTGRRSTTVFLDPLPDAAVRRLLDGLVSDLPTLLRDELVRRAQGVPLYAVETVRSLIDRDVVVPAGGRYVVDPDALAALDLHDLAPPASLHAVLAARLDALTPDERRIVQDASVLGLSFTRPGLAHLTPVGLDVEEALEGLRRKEILFVDDDPRSPERGQLRFMQALLRGVAYETLSRRDRKARHLAVAEHLATLPEVDAIASVLAEHVLDAAAAVPEDGDVELLEQRAGGFLQRAAEHALTVGAPRDALAHLDRLLALDPSDDLTLTVCERRVEVTMRLNAHFEAAMELAERGLAVAACTDEDDERVLRLRVYHSDLRLTLGDRSTDSTRDVREVFQVSRGRNDRVAVTLLAARSFVIAQQYVQDDPTVVQEVILGALADVERYGDDVQFATLLDALSLWCTLAGNRRLARIVRDALMADVDPRSVFSPSLFGNSAATTLFDDVGSALTDARRGREMAASLGLSSLSSDVHLLIALALAGRWDAGRALLDSREERTELLDWETYLAVGGALIAWWADDPTLLPPRVEGVDREADVIAAAWVDTFLALEHALRGDLRRAADLTLDAARAVAASNPCSEDLPLPVLLAVDFLLEAGDTDGLQRVVDLLTTIPPGQRYRMVQAQLLRAQAHLSDHPAPDLERAIELLDAMGAAYVAAAVRVELAQVLDDAGNRDRADEVLEQAAPLLRELGKGRAFTRLERRRPSAAAAPV